MPDRVHGSPGVAVWIDDQVIVQCEHALVIHGFVPEQSMVVLGASNSAEREANAPACAADGVAILKRYGGGGTVLLHQGCVVVTVGAWVRQVYQNSFYFSRLNAAVITVLQTLAASPLDLLQRGLSDIAVGEHKLAGTSLFRSRNYLLYQASILVDTKLELIERYLRHPSREPEYRAGRSHQDFLCGLRDFVPDVTPAMAWSQMAKGLDQAVRHQLDGELVSPYLEQIPHLLRRATSGVG